MSVKELDAVVSSVTKFGMFVELPNTVEGLIHISEINDDYYVFADKPNGFSRAPD